MTYLYPPTPEQERLLAIMYDNPDVTREPRKKVLERAEAGRALAVLGDPRAEVMTVDGMHFCYVPAGPFQLGSDGDKMAFKKEKPATQYEIPYNYWMARYPVTQAQFQEFTDDGGYQDERWWGVARADGFWSAAGYQVFDEPYDDGTPHVAPLPFEDARALPNHPVLGVSWYEGVAFAEWLTARWRANGILTEAQQVVLPGEPEWEKAARGGALVPQTPHLHAAQDGFVASPLPLIPNPLDYPIFPYGYRAFPFKSNNYRSNLRTTNAVGIFSAGKSLYGCEEMCGGVWEWTRSGSSHLGEGDKYPYSPACESPTGYRFRVLRGGCFYNGPRMMRCTSRYGESPTQRSDCEGVRLAVIPTG